MTHSYFTQDAFIERPNENENVKGETFYSTGPTSNQQKNICIPYVKWPNIILFEFQIHVHPFDPIQCSLFDNVS